MTRQTLPFVNPVCPVDNCFNMACFQSDVQPLAGNEDFMQGWERVDGEEC